jgi:two-component system, LuxR family, response regulator FixJ
MSSRSHVHIIDHDSRRRARIAYELAGRGVHAEIYESLDEFATRLPDGGEILLADGSTDCDPAALREVIEAARLVLPFALYSGEPTPQRIVAAMLSGARDYLRWPFDPDLLEVALERLSHDGEHIARQQRRKFAAEAAVGELSEREFEVLELMMLGLSNKEIGANLGISPRTVEIHRGNMMRKLNARSPSDAVRLAMHAGLDGTMEPERIAA